MKSNDSIGLWLARELNYTFLVHVWMEKSLEIFDLSSLHPYYCFAYEQRVSLSQDFRINRSLFVASEELYYGYEVVINPRYESHKMPKLTTRTVYDVSQHFLVIHGLLWSHPNHVVMKATLWIIDKKLSKELSYTSVHKRSFDNKCNEFLWRCKTPAFCFPHKDVDAVNTTWIRNTNHPLCEMSMSFIAATQCLHRRCCEIIHLMYDGDGDTKEYIAAKPVITNENMVHKIIPKQESHDYLVLVDMFVSINSHLFILNPYSTFSFQVQIIRILLGLTSVPVTSTDIFFRFPQRTNDALWVNVNYLQQIVGNNKD